MKADLSLCDLRSTTPQGGGGAQQLCMILQGAAGGEQSATATAERLGGQSETLQGATAELKRQLEQQSSQLSSQAAEVGNTRKKVQETQVTSQVLVPVGSLEELQMTLGTCETRAVLHRRLSCYSAECQQHVSSLSLLRAFC